MGQRVALLTAAGLDRDIRGVKTAESLTSAGYEVTVYCGHMASDAGRYPFRVVSHEGVYHADGAVVRRLWDKLHYFGWLLHRLHEDRPDLLHACNLDMLAVAVLAARGRVPVLYDSYEICTDKEGLVSSSRLLHHCAVLAERLLLPKAKGMLCVSTAARDYFQNTYGVWGRLQVVTNAPRSTQACPLEQRLPLRVAYIGRYGRNRGIEELLEGISMLPPEIAQAELFGFGPMENRLREKYGTDRCRIGGRAAPEEIHGLLTRASVGAVLTKPTSLNHRLTVSNKLFDYIHAGLPVLMSDVEEHRRLNDRYHFGLVLPEVTAAEVKKAICRLAEDRKLYEELSRNACRAAAELNWEQEEEKLLAAYGTWMA